MPSTSGDTGAGHVTDDPTQHTVACVRFISISLQSVVQTTVLRSWSAYSCVTAVFPLGSHLNPYNEYADHSYLGPNIGNEMNVLHTHYLPAFVLHTAQVSL